MEARGLIPLLGVTLVLLLSCAGGRSVSEDPDIARGRMYLQRGQFDSAEIHFGNAVRRAGADGDFALGVQARKWMGSVLLALDQPGRALEWYASGLSLLDSLETAGGAASLAAERRNLLNNRALAEERLGHIDTAETLYRRVLALDSAAGDNERRAITLNNLGMLYDRKAVDLDFSDDSSGAFVLHQLARRQFLTSLALHADGDTWMNLGNNHVHAMRYDSAIACYAVAAGMYAAAGRPAREALVEGNRGFVLEYFLNDREGAVGAFGRSTGLLERLRGNISSIDMRASFLANWYHLYDEQIGLLVDLDRPDQAFDAAERAKARALLDLIGNRDIGGGKDLDGETRLLVDEEAQLRGHLAALLTEPDSADVYALLSRRYGEVLSQLRRRNPELASVRSVEPVTADSLVSLLDAGSAVLEYYIGESAGYAFVLRPGREVTAARLREAGSAEIAAKVEEVRSMLFRDFPAKKMEVLREARMQRRLSADEAMRSWQSMRYPPLWHWKLVELYSRLLEPVEEELSGVRRLYVVPHGALHQLPFAALVRPGQRDVEMDVHIQRPRYLIEDMAVAYLPSASVLPYALARGRKVPQSGLIVGDPAYADPRYRRMPLPGALVEADTVASYVPDALLLTGPDAVESTVLRDMTGRDIIHFATHGELNPTEPMKSRILFAADNGCGCDGSLTVEEIFNLDIDATLVALSACQTAQVAGRGGGSAAGDELVGLTRSFLFAGTPAVLASLWVVDDQATLSWMREFYRSWLRKGLAPVDAARAAALGMLQTPADPDWIFPYYWAAFIYFGAMTDVSVSP